MFLDISLFSCKSYIFYQFYLTEVLWSPLLFIAKFSWGKIFRFLIYDSCFQLVIGRLLVYPIRKFLPIEVEISRILLVFILNINLKCLFMYLFVDSAFFLRVIFIINYILPFPFLLNIPKNCMYNTYVLIHIFWTAVAFDMTLLTVSI